MKSFQMLLIVFAISCLAGCHLGYAEITCTVIDAETQQPIDGAIVLVEWTKTLGYGLTTTKSFKVSEVISDKSGMVKLPGISDKYVNDPDVTVYKQGYVAWNSNFIFPPGYTKRTDFSWKDGYVFSLVKFKPEYTYRNHINFIYSSMNTSNIENKKLMNEAIRWEEKQADIEMK